MPRLQLSEFRARFPVLARRIYVNNCSQGALSTDVAEAIGAFLHSWDEHGSPWDAWVDQVRVLRETFARSIGADADEVAVMPSASAGIDVIASALDFTGERRRVVMGEFEFPTMAQVWLAQERRGAEIGWARARGDELPTQAYGAEVDDRTLLVPATHVCFRNGYRLDVAHLTALCHERGAYVFLDDYQRSGSGALDVHALGVDFMVTGCLKYLLGPSGVAFLYVRRGLIDRLEPTVTGWFGRMNPFEFRIDRLDWAATASRFEAGTPPIPNVYGALAGLRLLERVGYDAVEQQIASLVERFRDGAAAAGYAVATPADPLRRGPLVVVRSVDAQALVGRLAARGIVGSARGNGLRISFHGYNTTQDVDAVLEALEAERDLLERAPAAQRAGR